MCLFAATQSFINLKLIRRFVRVDWTLVNRLVVLVDTRARLLLLLLLRCVCCQHLLVVSQVVSGALVICI